MAYRLAGSIEEQQQALQYLEWREKQYDKRVRVDIFTKDSADVPVVAGALVYLATDGPQNVNYLGPATLQDIAQQVAAAVGPSGPNYEYVLRLADAMRQVCCCCGGGWGFGRGERKGGCRGATQQAQSLDIRFGAATRQPTEWGALFDCVVSLMPWCV